MIEDAFIGLDAHGVAAVRAAVTPVEVPASRELFRQGDAADSLFLLTDGSAEVVFELDLAEPIRVAVLGPGQVVGEMGLVSDEPRSATVRALEPSSFLRLARSDYERIAEKHPDIVAELSRIATSRLAGQDPDAGVGVDAPDLDT